MALIVAPFMHYVHNHRAIQHSAIGIVLGWNLGFSFCLIHLQSVDLHHSSCSLPWQYGFPFVPVVCTLFDEGRLADELTVQYLSLGWIRSGVVGKADSSEFSFLPVEGRSCYWHNSQVHSFRPFSFSSTSS